MEDKKIRIGIDATNLNLGGGRSHILNIVEKFNPSKHNIERITIYGTQDLLDSLPSFPWLDKKTFKLLNKGLMLRYVWLLFFSKSIFKVDCDILFSPSGLYFGNFKPYVSMSRNMMLFDKVQMNVQKGVLKYKLLLSRFMNVKSMKNADGVIFISEFAHNEISKELRLKSEMSCKINHGISDRFKKRPFERNYVFQRSHLINILYVSHVYSYKHPWNVVKAISKLFKEGYLVNLDLVGGGNKLDINRLNKTIGALDPERLFVKYHGNQPYSRINEFYKNADIFVYASTCENMPNILLESMSASLPIACSKYEPMPEFLEDAGIYFDPLEIDSIYNALKELINSESKRRVYGERAYNLSENYSWEKTSIETFNFLEQVFRRYSK
ncbi:glycosyltransferase family 4 protein [Sphingobacterium hotanense]|uniref:glycosyltransferase family 4 protein n=1 Tax=Sphingobacterium hotanense TaxID=649196 RepID=UPI0021A547E9|nr:glycosyltransferase family 1 protein [Sphingobacterium hotanense]MCT1523552.1 glycosyltransferase family 4 protein [Sphingobacterium hotanense]